MGYYTNVLVVSSANYPTSSVNLFTTVDDRGKGDVLFHVLDLYYGYNDGSGTNTGVSSARIALEEQGGSNLRTNITTGVGGEAWFRDLPIGRYNYRITANRHQDYSGSLWIRPGVVLSEEVFLQYTLVTVEWSVTPITIEDRYEIVLQATFQTQVPAPVVVPSPASVALPAMQAGDVFNGEFVLANHGLQQAQGLTVGVPPADEHFRFEIMANPASTLGAGQTVRVPYRITCLSSLDGSGAGGCSTYSVAVPVTYFWECAFGNRGNGDCVFWAFRTYGTCSVGLGAAPGTFGGPQLGGSLNLGGSGGTTGGGTSGGPSASATPLSGSERICTPPCPDCEEQSTCPCNGRKVDVGSSSVDLTSGKFEEDVTDISVKVAGGYVSLTRTYENNEWSFNKYWGDLSVETDSSGAVSAIVKNGITYQRADQIGHVFTYGNDYTIYRNVSGAATNYRWQARSGDWKEYDANGRLQVYGDRNNVKVFLMRDAMNNVVGVQDHFTNQVLWIGRDENGRVASVSDAATGGRIVSYAYDGAGRLTGVTDVLGRTTSYGYDGNGRLNTVTQPGNTVTTIAYDNYGFVIGVSRPDGYSRTFDYGYDEYKKQYYGYVRTAGGRVEEKWFDAVGTLIKSGLNGEITYDASAAAAPTGLEPAYEYDARGNVTRITYPDGAVVTKEYDATGEYLVKDVNERGVTKGAFHFRRGSCDVSLRQQ